MPVVKCIAVPNKNALREGEVLEVGKQYEMDQNDANRWIRRGVVETVEVKAAPNKPEVSDEPKTDGAAGDKPGNAGRGKAASAT